MRSGPLIVGIAVFVVIIAGVMVVSLLEDQTPAPTPPPPTRPAPDSPPAVTPSETKPPTKDEDAEIEIKNNSNPDEDPVDPDTAILIDEFLDEATQPQTFPADHPIRQRIGRDVVTLRREDPATSLKMLSEIGMYYWPGVKYDGAQAIRIPFKETVGEKDIELILSNRRVLKVLAECAAMPNEQAGVLVRDELHAALAQYKTMFDTEWEHVKRVREEHPIRERENYTIGPSLQLSNNRDGTPTLSGLRYKILSLMLIAGNLGLVEAREAVEAATTMALQQRETFYSPQEGLEGDRFAMLKDVGIYHRQVIITAIHGISAGTFDDESLWDRRTLTVFDAQGTTYDMLRADFSKGTLHVWVRTLCDDPAFDQFMASRE